MNEGFERFDGTPNPGVAAVPRLFTGFSLADRFGLGEAQARVGCADAPLVSARVGRSRALRFKLAFNAVRSALCRGMHFYHARARLHVDVEAQWGSPLAFLDGILAVGESLEAFMDTSPSGDPACEGGGDACLIVLFASLLEPEVLAGALKLPMAQLEVLNLEGPRGTLADALPPLPS